MDNSLDRIERDRTLYEQSAQNQLFNLLANADTRMLTKVVGNLIRQQVLVEEMAGENGLEINERTMEEYLDKNRDYINQQVKRATTDFISSIVSQEG